jgi:PST family polysaccharide transporter
MIAATSVMPKLLQTREINPDRYYARVQIFYQTMILVSVVVTVLTMLFGPMLVTLVYGHQYSSAAGILSIHIWTGIFVAVGCIGGQQYVHEKVTISSLQRAAWGAVVNIVLNILWIPRWGGMGSAMATLVSYSISSYFGDALDRRTRSIFFMKTRAYLQFWTLPRLLFQGATK